MLWTTACDWTDNSPAPYEKHEATSFQLNLAFLGPPRSTLPPPPTTWSLPKPAVPTDVTGDPLVIVPAIRPVPEPLSLEKPATPQASTPTPARAAKVFFPTPAVSLNSAVAVPIPIRPATPAPTPTPQAPASATNLPTPTGAPLHTPTPSPTPTLTPSPTVTLVPELTVPLVLESYSEVVQTGQEFQLTVKVEAGHTRPVDAAQIYLDFDPAILEVVAIRPGSHLGYLLQSTWDNSRGRLAYAAGTLDNPFEFPFTFCNVVFRAKAPTVRGSTLVQFDDPRPPRQSKAIYRGLDVTGHLTSVRIRVR